MRPFEALLLLADLLACFVLAVRLPGLATWIRHLAPLPLPIAAVQMLVEGPRWQMAPAYVLSALFFLLWLLRDVSARDNLAAHRLAAGLAIGLGVLGLAVAIALPLILPVFRFPSPTGPYQIGTLTYHWGDTGRPEVFAADPAARRELMVQIW